MKRSERQKHRHVMQYRILDTKRGVPTRKVIVHASSNDVQHLVEKGFLVRHGLISSTLIGRLRTAISKVLAAESHQECSLADSCFGSPYLRYLLDKHQAFSSLLRIRSTLSIARATLGPQIKFDEITARVIDLSSHSPATPWHIHLRVVPDPLPAFFAYPHAIECLLYLDDIDKESGPLCVLPGSHRRMNEIYPLGDITEKPDQEILFLKAGDCLVMHPNLWHRSLPSVRQCGLRRLIIFGYLPSWICGEERGPSRPRTDLLADMRRHGNALDRELAGEFYWG